MRTRQRWNTREDRALMGSKKQFSQDCWYTSKGFGRKRGSADNSVERQRWPSRNWSCEQEWTFRYGWTHWVLGSKLECIGGKLSVVPESSSDIPNFRDKTSSEGFVIAQGLPKGCLLVLKRPLSRYETRKTGDYDAIKVRIQCLRASCGWFGLLLRKTSRCNWDC